MAKLLDYGYEFVGASDLHLKDDRRELTEDRRLISVPFNMTRKNFVNFRDMAVKVLNPADGVRYAGLDSIHGFWRNANLQNFTASEICGLSRFRSLPTYKYAMVVRKSSPLREALNKK